MFNLNIALETESCKDILYWFCTYFYLKYWRFIYYSRPPYFGYKTPMFTFKWLFVVKLVQGSNSEYKGKWKEQNCPNNRDYKFFLTYQNQKWSSHFVHCFLMKVCNQDLKNICIEWENKICVRKRKLFHQITKYNWFLCNMYFKLKKSPSLCQLALCYSTKIL